MLLILMVLASAANAHGQDIDSWTPKSLKARFGEVHVKYVDRKIKTITLGPINHFHGPQCLGLILEVLRGPNDIPNPKVEDLNLEITNDDSVWTDHKTNVTINQLQGFVFVAVKSTDVTKPGLSNGSVVLTAHLVDDEQGERLVLSVDGT
jgi:hypothetical protein